MSARLIALLLACVALCATANVRAQQRDISDLFPDTGPASDQNEADAGPEAPPSRDAGGEGEGTRDPAAEPDPDLDPTLDPDEPTIPDDAIPTLPEGHEPTITVRLTPTEGLMTGDVVHYELTVEVPEGDDVNLPRQTYAPLELIGQDHVESVVNGRRRFVYTLDLLALEPGEITIPGLVVRVITADGIVGAARTEPQTITIGSLVANEPDAQPRPPTEPVVVMQDDYTLAYIAGALGLMLLGGLIAWLFMRWWRKRPKELPPPPPPRPAYEVALERLRALRRELTPAIADGSQGRIVDGASDALREYLGHRFGFNGLESTTDEVIARMRHQRMAGVTLAEITSLLGECDLVKFAKAIPDESDCEKVIQEAERIVQRTMHANVVSIAQPAGPIPATTKEPKLLDPAMQPRPERMSAAASVASASAASASVASASAAGGASAADPSLAAPPRGPSPIPPAPREGITSESSASSDAAVAASESADLASVQTAPAGSRSIPLTNPPPAPDAKTLEDFFTRRPETTPSFAIPETPVPPPPPRDSDPGEPPPRALDAGDLLAKATEALAKASEAVAKAPEGTKSASTEGAKASVQTAILGGALPQADESVWDALEDAVADDQLIVGEVVARREEGFLIALGSGVHGVLPEAQLGGLDADAIVGEKRAFRVVSLNAGKKRVVLSHKDVDDVDERRLLGRATPIGFFDPSGGAS